MPDPQLPRIGFPEAEKTAKLSPDSLHDVVKTYFEAEYTSENWPFRQNGQPCLLPAKLVEEIMPLILRGQAAEALVKSLEPHQGTHSHVARKISEAISAYKETVK
jgi:hypothetical protein